MTRKLMLPSAAAVALFVGSLALAAPSTVAVAPSSRAASVRALAPATSSTVAHGNAPLTHHALVSTGAAGTAAAGLTPALFRVGAAKADITPSAAILASGAFYTGGYGFGPDPSHLATSVLRHI